MDRLSTERYLTFSLRMDTEPSGEPGVLDDAQIGARRALAYEAFASRLREEPGVTHVAHGDRLPTVSPEWLQLRNIATLQETVAQQQAPSSLGGVVFGSVLIVAVIFCAAGLYALMAVAVARRTREIGIRISLGANPRRVLGSMFAHAGCQRGGGIIGGNTVILFIAWRSDSVTAELLVSSLIASVVMTIVGLLACAAPARRALRVQPTEALREIDAAGGESRSQRSVAHSQYLRRLGELETRRPAIGGDVQRFDAVRLYREAVVRLSLATTTAIALDAQCLDDAIRATYCDSDVAALFRMAMQCQIMDDVIDYRKDLSAGLPSFLTASASLPKGLARTAEAVRRYAASGAAGGGAFPLEAALQAITLATKFVVAVARRREVRDCAVAR